MSPARRAAPPPVPIRRELNTLQKLWGSLYLIWGLDALLLITAIIGAQVHRNAMQGVGKDSAPSIIHAQHIKAAMADMDANAANELLGDPGKMTAAVDTYEKRRKEAATALIEAAKNITYAQEQEQIEALQLGLGTYEVGIQRARDLHEEADKEFVNAYRNAAVVMDTELLPHADQLDGVNNEALEKIYDSLSNRSVGTVFLLLMAGAFLLGALVVVQKFLNEKTHRILNPLLVASTLITLWFVSYTFVTLGSERHRLKVAKEDAFTSIRALWRARAVAYAANADESRYLLDPSRTPEHETAFFAKADQISGDKGYLQQELKNITFEGEREAAEQAVKTFDNYLTIDKEIRRLQKSGKHAEALELCIGTKDGESNWAFDQFDKALGQTIDINQQAFDGAVARGFDALSYFELKASIVAVVIALLAFFGLLKRIQEYQ